MSEYAGLVWRRLRTAVVLCGTLVVCGTRQASAQEDTAREVLVRTNPGISASRLAADYGSSVDDCISGCNTYSLSVPAGTTQRAFLSVLLQDSRVSLAELQQQVVPAEFSGAQMHLAFDGGNSPGKYANQHAYKQVNLGDTHTISRGSGIVVAVIDTGAALNHPALAGHLIRGYNAIRPGTSEAETRDGTTNVAMGHGTMVAGLIARLAPGAGIMPVRVLNGDGIGTLTTVVRGIHYAVTHGARVINLSLGSATYSEVLDEEISSAVDGGVVVVASAGNDGAEVLHYPAALEHVIGVAAVDDNNRKSSYSNFGGFISNVAPGTAIRSTYWTGGYANWTGTSFATPFVAAEAALILSVRPDLEQEKVRECMSATSHSVAAQNPGFNGLLGDGIIDYEAAVKTVVTGESPDDGTETD